MAKVNTIRYTALGMLSTIFLIAILFVPWFILQNKIHSRVIEKSLALDSLTFDQNLRMERKQDSFKNMFLQYVQKAVDSTTKNKPK